LRIHQLIRDGLEVPVHRVTAPRKKFLITALVGGELDRVAVVMIVCKRVEGQSDLPQVTDALRLAGAHSAFGNRGQKQGGEDRDNGNDHEQLDEREPASPRTMPKCFHGVS